MKILIAGGPRTGKTSLAKKLAETHEIQIKCTDDVIHQFEWSRASLEVASWFYDERSWVIEGTIVVRAIRRWLLQTSMRERCADVIYYGAAPFTATTKDQQRMISGCNTVWNEIRGELQARGMRLEPIRRVATP